MGPRDSGRRAPPFRLNCLGCWRTGLVGRQERSSFPDKLRVSCGLKALLFYATNPSLPSGSDCTLDGLPDTCPVPGILGQEQAVPLALTRDPESFVACLVGEQTEFPTRRAGSGNPAPPASRLESGRGASNLFQ